MKTLKRYLLIACLLTSTLPALAQQKHFVYLQTEDLTPFYIQMNGKTVSSTAAGYLLLGKLTDSIYMVKLGVLGSGDVQEYGIRVQGRDAGYVIKKSAETGWSITDINTNAMQMSMEWSAAIAAENARKKAMEEAELLRIKDSTANARQAALDATLALEKQRKEDSIQVADDAAAAQKTVADTNTVQTISNPPAVVVPVTPAPQKPTEEKPIVVAEKKAISPADSLAQVIAQKEKELKDLQAALQAANEAKAKPAAANVVEKPVAKATVATPVSNNQTTEKKPAMLDMEFSMKADSGAAPKALPAVKDTAEVAVVAVDTIAAAKVEPVAKPALDTLTNVAVVTEQAAKDSVAKSVVVEPDVPKEKIVGNAPAPAPTADSVVAASPTVVKRTPCVEILSRSDVDAAMADNGKLSNADEIATAYATLFKDKCVTTTNLKKICNSLASDVTRYKVLEAAYPYTVDYYAFGELSGLIKDSYYSSKFKSLIQQ
ncbi:MAG: hypothetical protein IT252_16800 [Chitinophagaceae bacterium]|nr:hypothetical protein [Chitinophagaceae bacterium]